MHGISIHITLIQWSCAVHMEYSEVTRFLFFKGTEPFKRVLESFAQDLIDLETAFIPSKTTKYLTVIAF